MVIAGGLRIPSWFFGLIGAIGITVSATIYVIRDRTDVENRLNRIELRQCAILRYIASQDARFDAPIFLQGCP